VTDAAVLGISADAITRRGSFSSMDPDGFTINFAAPIDQASRLFSLALAGVAAKAGKFNKVTGIAPTAQTLPQAGFRPGLLLLSSVQDLAQTSLQVGSRWGVGAADGTSQATSALSDANGATTSSTAAIDRTTSAFVKMANDKRVTEAECSVSALSEHGVTLNWTTNDAVATELTYLMLGTTP
jgi:hypothetical protein